MRCVKAAKVRSETSTSEFKLRATVTANATFRISAGDCSLSVNSCHTSHSRIHTTKHKIPHGR